MRISTAHGGHRAGHNGASSRTRRSWSSGASFRGTSATMRISRPSSMLWKVNETIPLDGLRWSLEHAETISPQNIARVKKLGGGIALDGKMALHADGFIKTYGREKALETPRLRTLVDSGIPLAMTTDAFRAATYNPWVGISWMVTGKSVSGSEALAKDNRLTRAGAGTVHHQAPGS